MVDVSTRGDVHAEITIATADAKKHIICEKPLANTRAAAQRMLKAAFKHMLMHNYRKIPAVTIAKKRINDGRLGDIYPYHGAYLQHATQILRNEFLSFLLLPVLGPAFEPCGLGLAQIREHG